MITSITAASIRAWRAAPVASSALVAVTAQ